MNFTPKPFSVLFLCSSLFKLFIINSASPSTISHAEPKIDKRASVIGTFRFDRLDSRARGKDGWKVQGCYCPSAGDSCICSRSTNHVNMVINQRRPRERQQSSKRVRYRTRLRSALGTKTVTIRARSGCFCSHSGCRGSACQNLNGCVCNRRGRCWGSKCPTFTMNRSEEFGPYLSHKESMAAESEFPPFLLKNLSDLNFNHGRYNWNQKPLLEEKSDGCFCQTSGCHGSMCDQMNGCFCSHSDCWGKYCLSEKYQAKKIAEESKIVDGFSPTYGRKNFKKSFRPRKFSSLKSNFMGPSDGPVSLSLIKTMLNDKFVKPKMKEIFNENTPSFTIDSVKGHGIESFGSNFIENIGGKFIENIGGEYIENIAKNSSYPVKKLSGQPISLIQGHPIQSASWFPVDKIEGLEVSSYPAAILPKVVGTPVGQTSGLEIGKVKANMAKKALGHASEKIIGVPVKSVNKNLYETLTGNLVETIKSSGQPIVAKPIRVINSHDQTRIVEAKKLNSYNLAPNAWNNVKVYGAQSLQDFLTQKKVDNSLS